MDQSAVDDYANFPPIFCIQNAKMPTCWALVEARGTAAATPMATMSERDAGAVTRSPEKRASAAIVRPKPLHETVVERLRNMIVEGALASGERLHDANLARILQVSRTPIREATKLLATEGLVDLLPGRGARVSELSIEDILDLFETIAGIERHACELAAERMSGPELDKLQRAHKRMARHHAAGERRPYFQLNHEIHLAIVDASKNTTLQAIHASLMSRARRARYAALSSHARWMEAMGEHELIMAALADRDPRRAGEIMRQHDLGTAVSIVAALRAAVPCP
jgi:DNA-binding GntR family transcriptional regulator